MDVNMLVKYLKSREAFLDERLTYYENKSETDSEKYQKRLAAWNEINLIMAIYDIPKYSDEERRRFGYLIDETG